MPQHEDATPMGVTLDKLRMVKHGTLRIRSARETSTAVQRRWSAPSRAGRASGPRTALLPAGRGPLGRLG